MTAVRQGQPSAVWVTSAVLALCAAAAVAATGCGGDASSGPDRARDTVEAFLRACAREEAPAVLPLLTPAQRQRFLAGGGTLEGCAQTAGIATGDPAATRRAVEDATVASILVDGDAATATLSMPGSEAGHVDLDERGLTWQVHAAPEAP